MIFQDYDITKLCFTNKHIAVNFVIGTVRSRTEFKTYFTIFPEIIVHLLSLKHFMYTKLACICPEQTCLHQTGY
jgi:hypothetical protein